MASLRTASGWTCAVRRCAGFRRGCGCFATRRRPARRYRATWRGPSRAARWREHGARRGGAPPESRGCGGGVAPARRSIVESWLVEEGEGFALSARRLDQLKSAGVPDRVIDVMVALSYPGVFAINLATHSGERRAPEAGPSTGGRPCTAWATTRRSAAIRRTRGLQLAIRLGLLLAVLLLALRLLLPIRLLVGLWLLPVWRRGRGRGRRRPGARHGRMVIGQGYTKGAAGQGARPARSRRSSSSSGAERSSGSGSSSGGSSSGSSSSGGSSSGGSGSILPAAGPFRSRRRRGASEPRTS